MTIDMNVPRGSKFRRKPSGKPCASSGCHTKKALRHPKSDEVAGTRFQERIAAHEAAGRPVVYIPLGTLPNNALPAVDEAGYATDMPRTHGYAPRGTRCHGTRDWHAKGRINVIGALLAGTLPTVGLAASNVDAETFNLWLEGDLIPKLPPEAVPVMDNATFHKRSDTAQSIRTAGHTLEFLPPCSPDLNKIEHTWAETEAERRRTGKSVEEVFKDKIWNQN